ncbi:hypothetical protein LDDCCGHA_0669 [Methylobacterium oxalidis]|nr:hypothetical protein LDDCCGHA_0669 [Methylobacterium oxalidis]
MQSLVDHYGMAAILMVLAAVLVLVLLRPPGP